jgi:tubulin beta
MGTKLKVVLCDEHGIGGGGLYCGDNDAHLGRMNAFYQDATGGRYVPRAVLMDLEPGVINAVTLSRRSANSSARETS